MSRIGKKPIPIPSGVKVNISGNKVSVSGPKGNLEREFHDLIQIEMIDNTIKCTPKDDSRLARQLHGLTRTLINNMILGVTQGFKKELIVTGVGYKADVKGNTLQLSLGYSHTIDYPIPKGVQVKVDKEKGIRIILESHDKELLGLTAAKIRSFKKPEPYKGKGIQYADEVILRKAGKTTGKAKKK